MVTFAEIISHRRHGYQSAPTVVSKMKYSINAGVVSLDDATLKCNACKQIPMGSEDGV
jgi:hypothetical protein